MATFQMQKGNAMEMDSLSLLQGNAVMDAQIGNQRN